MQPSDSFQDTFELAIMFRDLAFLRFTVADVANNHVTAQRVIPINYLRPGYRHVRLNNMQNQPLPLSSLFIHTRFEEEGLDVVHSPLHDPTSLAQQSVENCAALLRTSGSFSNTLKDEPELESPTGMKSSPVQDEKAGEAPVKRRMFFLIVYGVQNVGAGPQNSTGATAGIQREEEPYVILKVTQDCTTETVIRKALSKISTSSTTSAGPSSLQLHDYLLLEEVNRGWEPPEKLMPPLQRILDAKERPLEAQAKWKGEGRLILRRIGDDPSSRAWLSSILNSNQKMKLRKVRRRSYL